MAIQSNEEEREQAEGRFDDEGGRQVAPRVGAVERARARDRSPEISDTTLRDLTVLTADGQALGRVVSIRINLKDWHVGSVEVELDRDMRQALGVRRHLFRSASVAIPTELIETVRDAIILSRTTAQLRHLESDASAALH